MHSLHISQSPFSSSNINQILRVESRPGYLSWFQVSLRSVEKCASCGGLEISAFPLTWYIAYTTACCYHAVFNIDEFRFNELGYSLFYEC